MGKILSIKPNLNKNNKQISLTLPKKKIPKKFLKKIYEGHNIKLDLDLWD